MSDYRNILAGKDWVYTIVRPKPKHNKTKYVKLTCIPEKEVREKLKKKRGIK